MFQTIVLVIEISCVKESRKGKVMSRRIVKQFVCKVRNEVTKRKQGFDVTFLKGNVNSSETFHRELSVLLIFIHKKK